jgi:hypothetical protein
MASAGEVEATALVGGSTAVSPATDSAGRANLRVEVFLVEEIMAASVIAVSVAAIAAFVAMVFATLMGAFSALDIRTITRFIIPTITRILSTGVIWDTKGVPPVGRMPSPQDEHCDQVLLTKSAQFAR